MSKLLKTLIMAPAVLLLLMLTTVQAIGIWLGEPLPRKRPGRRSKP